MIAGFQLRQDHETARRCTEHPEAPAIGWIYQADDRGGVNRASREPACMDCARKAGYKGNAASKGELQA